MLIEKKNEAINQLRIYSEILTSIRLFEIYTVTQNNRSEKFYSVILV